MVRKRSTITAKIFSIDKNLIAVSLNTATFEPRNSTVSKKGFFISTKETGVYKIGISIGRKPISF